MVQAPVAPRPPALARLAADLREIGASVAIEQHSQLDPIFRVHLDELERSFVIQQRRRPAHRGEIDELRALQITCSRFGAPLLLVPSIGAEMANKLTGEGWSWADERGNFFLQAPGLRLARAGQTRPLEPTTAKLPGGVGGRRMLRWLINAWDEANPISITALAELVGVTQAAGSLFVKQLRELGFVGSPRGLGQVDRQALLYEFVRQYAGAGGQVQHARGHDAPGQIAHRLAQTHQNDIAISADVGPHWLVSSSPPPELLVVYAREPIELEPLDVVPVTDAHQPNVFIHYPADRSVFVDYELPQLRSPSLADPTQMYIDLLRLGGDDRHEAAAMLEAWILQ